MRKSVFMQSLDTRVNPKTHALKSFFFKWRVPLALGRLGRQKRGIFYLAITVALFLAALAPTSAWAIRRAPVTSLMEMRENRVVVQKWDLSCGAAALATILQYQYGDLTPEREIAKSLMQREEYIANPVLVQVRQGFSLLDLKRYVDSQGYEGIGYGKLTLQALVEHAPIMVPVDLYGYNHFVVFRGIYKDRVLLADPAWGNRTMRIKRFEQAWIDYPEIGKVGFVVTRRDGAPSLNGLAPRARDFVRF